MNPKSLFTLIALSITIFGLTACSFSGVSVSLPQQDALITASGTIDADNIRLAPELSGKVNKLYFEKGNTVKAGDVVFQLDDALLQAKYDQVKAQVQQATAMLEVAKQNLEYTKAEYQVAIDARRTQSGQIEANRWKETNLVSVLLPNWYFQKSEAIAAYQSEITNAQSALDQEQEALQTALEKASNKDFVQAESRVNRAQAEFLIADQTLTQANAGVGNDRELLTDAVQKMYDQAKTELDAAQQAYNAMLTETSATDVKEARARVAAAQARLENAQDKLNTLLTRDDSQQLEVAKAGVDAAQKTVDQARANISVVQAAQREIEVQLGKMSVSSPISGIVLSNPIKAGETVAAGATIYEVGALDDVKLTVYVTEDQFGRINLGDNATVKVDSYPKEVFQGKVVHIANEAEFTPRNVQTTESRSTTVYAVEIRLPNPDHKLKPGMPADATIQ